MALLLFVSCTEDNHLVQSVRSPAGEFSAKVLPIFEQNCGSSSCHGGGPQGFAGGLDLTFYAGILRGSRYGAVVIPGNPFMSHIVQVVNRVDTTLSPIADPRMSASRDPLDQQDVQTIIEWIRTGAQDDDGTLPFPEERPAGRVLFTCQSMDLVGEFDLGTGLITRYTNVGNALPMSGPPQAPHNVQIDDQGEFFYVTLIAAGKLRKYSLGTGQFLGEVSVGVSPAHVVITSDGEKAYVTNFNLQEGKVYAVTTSSMAVERVVSSPLMKGGHGARISHDGKYLYVANFASDLLTVIQVSNDSIVAHVPVAPDVPPFGSFVYGPIQVAVRTDDRFLYVTLNNKGLLSVIERVGDAFIFSDTIHVGTRPIQCEVTRDQRFVYVCNQGSGSVSVVDAQTNQLYTTIEEVGKQPHGVDISEDSRTAFITCENISGGDPPHHPIVGGGTPGFLVMINIATQDVVRRIEVGGFSAGIAISPGKGN